MKKYRILIAIFLGIFVCVGWIVQIGNTIKVNQQYENYIVQAENYLNEELYQKAITAYENAYSINAKDDLFEKKVEAYKLSYLDGTSSLKEYATVLEEFCKMKNDDSSRWEELIQLYVDNMDYKSAFSIINKCQKVAKNSETLTALIQDVKYSFIGSKKTYTQYYRSANGYYTLYDDTNWGIMNPSGEWLYECEYVYTSPINQNLDVLMTSAIGNRIIDKSGVVQAKISQECFVTNAYGNGYLPMQNENGKWQYYSCIKNEYVWDQYEYATAFQNEKAVIQNEKKWRFIDINGNLIEGIEFDDVKIYGNGEYMYLDTMIASKNGKYYIYNSNCEKKSDTSYDDMDVYLGEYIAYMDKGGKWGFVDEDGKVVIEPVFEKAKSFSNGLAAVYDGSKWGFINEEGKLVIDYQFREADYFTDEGICFVSTYQDLYYMIQLRFN